MKEGEYKVEGQSDTNDTTVVPNPLVKTDIQKEAPVKNPLKKYTEGAESAGYKLITKTEYDGLLEDRKKLTQKDGFIKTYFKSPTFLNTALVGFISITMYLVDSSKIWNFIGNKISQAQNQSSPQSPQ